MQEQSLQEMNTEIKKLFEITQKKEILVLGLMSGTSLDGLDLALCRFFEQENSPEKVCVEVLCFETIPYENSLKSNIQTIFAKKNADLETLAILNAHLGRLYAQWILEFLHKNHFNPSQIDCIASHGQTVYHTPKHLHLQISMPHATLQIVDADHIAHLTGIITLSDFRQKHVAIGGQGAPMALYGDVALFAQKGENRILLNIGGISNFTFLPADLSAEGVFATDTGTGSTLIDFYTQKLFSKPYDSDGFIASQGKLNVFLLDELLKNPFFEQKAPKTTGQETFSPFFVEQCLKTASTDFLEPLSNEDFICTLTYFSAKSIANEISKIDINHLKTDIYVSGGGARNRFLMQILQDYLPNFSIKDFSVLGVSPDAKEAVLFATLAYQTLKGNKTALMGLPSANFGKISLPS